MTAIQNAAAIAALTATVNKLATDSQTYNLLTMGALAFTMQAGFLCLEVGTIRMKNTRPVLIKNLIDVCVTAFFYWGFGYAFAFGESQLQTNKKNAGFIGDTNYFLLR